MNQRALIIYGFETSNNIKVRLALEHKGIPYEFRTIEPTDRDELVQVSGQFHQFRDTLCFEFCYFHSKTSLK